MIPVSSISPHGSDTHCGEKLKRRAQVAGAEGWLKSERQRDWVRVDGRWCGGAWGWAGASCSAAARDSLVGDGGWKCSTSCGGCNTGLHSRRAWCSECNRERRVCHYLGPSLCILFSLVSNLFHGNPFHPPHTYPHPRPAFAGDKPSPSIVAVTAQHASRACLSGALRSSTVGTL